MKTKTMKRLFTLLLAAGCALVLSVPIMAFAALQTNYNWYRGHEADSTYQIETAGELAALSMLVNGMADYDGDGTPDVEAVDFEGKTIVVEDGVTLNFLGNPIVPIGTEQTPFNGTFDGNGAQANNFRLIVSASDEGVAVSNVGLFGYVGPSGSISNMSVGSASAISITRDASSTDYIANVGMLVGYCAGTVTNCENRGALTIASEVAQQSAENSVPVRNVGGVVGQCVYDVVGCDNSGTVTISETASPDADIQHAQLVARVGGVAGLLGSDDKIGTYENHIYGRADQHGEVRNCTNTGLIDIDTPMLSGLDRFGEQAEAESVAIGGVVGYSQGSVYQCTNGRAVARAGDSAATVNNTGYIRAKNGIHVGGVCGSLRGVVADNMNVAWADDGADGEDPLVIEDCMNYGDVYGRCTVGGIAGKASSYTTITGCVNSNKKTATGSSVNTYIVATRWNKPSPAGIVGTANGIVSYCANLATVASGSWSDEGSRLIKVQSGYYAAGIAGMLTYFDNRADEHGGKSTPVSEVFSCYNAGTITAVANMRQRGIVGQNDGYTHDNVLLEGVVYNDNIVYGEKPDEIEASGTVGENRVYTASDLRGDKAAEAVAFLNRNSDANGWDQFWIIPVDATQRGLNQGFPLLESQNPWGDSATLITNATVALDEDAPYTGSASSPKVTVTLDGVELVANADYRVLPQEDAIMPSTSRPYRASVVGLGRYAGTAAQTVAYDIRAGDIGTCNLKVAVHTFDFEEHVPKVSDVTVTTPAGTVVDPDEYTYQVVDADGNEIHPIDADRYRFIATAKEGSTLFSGTLEGVFRIKPASFMQEVKFDGVEIHYMGVDYPWVNSTETGESSTPSTTLPYTGVAVKPTVSGLSYKGHELIEGEDFRVVYGNSISDEAYAGDLDAYNLGRKGGSTIGCITVRYISGKKTNYSNYGNMFFYITDNGQKADLTKATYKADGPYLSDGREIRPVEIYMGGQKLSEGVDYTIEYENNVNPGTASFTATGIGTFEGTLSGTFEIEEGLLYTILYTFAGTGSASSPFEATVIGAEYNGSRDTFALTIPETVEHDGQVYTVSAIGSKAFGGGANDYTGTLANETKSKISSVSIPATVRSIGSYAFGSSTSSKHTPLVSVDLATQSQLTTIADHAFSRCEDLTSFTVPAGVQSIDNLAFSMCPSLSELRFLTTDADLPSSVATRKTGTNGAFYNCDGVVVRGYESASAVQEIATANGAATWGTHGGKNFTFEPFSVFSSSDVNDIAEQTFTGGEIKPAVTIRVGDTQLEEGTDFSVTYQNNVEVGTAKAIVVGMGAYDGYVEKEFTIAPADFSKVDFAPVDDCVYAGSAVSIPAQLIYRDYVLVEGKDYELSYADDSGKPIAAPTVVGQYRLIATGKGGFTGSSYRTFNIITATLDDAVVSPVGDRQYAGWAIEPDVAMRIGSSFLVRDRDYTLTYENNVNVGQATVHIHGMGSVMGECDASFRIVTASLANAQVTGVHDVQKTGRAVSFTPVVVLNGVELHEGVDYTMSYAKPAEDNSSGTSGKTFTLAAAGSPATLAAAETAVKAGETIEAPADEGDYFVVITGKGNYREKAECAFAITADAPAGKTDLSSAQAQLASTSVAYCGSACKPKASVSMAGTNLVEGTDFIVAYENNVNVGNAQATVYGTGAYTGSISLPFSVVKASISQDDVQPIADVEFRGVAAEPKVAIIVDGHSLVEGVDFTVSYAGNGAVGDATATVVGKGGYSGQVTISFVITDPPVHEWVRIAGGNRYDTMSAIVSAGFSRSEYAVVATGDSYPDALVASSVAGAYDCPVILTGGKSLSGRARDQLQRLGVKNVLIMGGDAAVSQTVEKAIKNMGIATRRIKGNTRTDTSVEAMKFIPKRSDIVVITTGFGYADSLSISPWSYASGAPIVLTQKNGTLASAHVKAIKDAGYKKYIILGGTAAVSDQVKSQLSGLTCVERIGGNTRYDTSRLIAEWSLDNGLTMVHPAISTGENFPDALAGAALQGKAASVMVLVKNENSPGVNALADNKSVIESGYVFGGNIAVPDAVVKSIADKTGMTYRQ